ncbi:hypothetical protein KFE25_009882 [Diacronema lutheri]|uniref:Uncharacterized protein n=1 Tax=Diacronema lutheri TaxID=2081491 RepID=A0A8J6C9F4_DIALT|nr:hypothetical protein KFE25_009882 [Diacronema lutheri]
MPDADAARDAILAEARERTAAMSAQEKRQLITHLRDNWAEDPAAASAFLSVDTTAATTLLVALLELGLLSEEAVQQVAREDAEIQQSSAAVVTQQRADDGYTQYQLELLRQVAGLTTEMMQGLSPFQQQQLLTLQHMTRTSGVLDRAGR